jgi:excisionase family DNA binding protein
MTRMALHSWTRCVEAIRVAVYFDTCEMDADGMSSGKSRAPVERFYTPSEIARMLRVSSEKVLGWIRRAELRAVNLGNMARSKYRVRPADLENFLRLREVQPPRPRRRRSTPSPPPEGGPIDPELGEKLLKTGEAAKVGGTYYRKHNGIILFF